MTYCTNCGIETSKRICPVCGVKRNTTHEFCEWCGMPLDEHATVCTYCEEKVKPKYEILKTILGVFLILCAVVKVAVILRILCLIAGVSLLPFANRFIVTKTKGKAWIRTARTVLSLVLLIAVISTVPKLPKEPSFVTNEGAIKAAETVFHERYELRNEDSYKLNEADVHITENYKGDKNWTSVIVTLDISAENGYGGTTREEFDIELLFNCEEGEYYEILNDGTKKKID